MSDPSVMDCPAARGALLDEQRGRLDPVTAASLHAHLDGCVSCARMEVAERLLTEQLERQLPQHGAALGLKRRLAAQWSSPSTVRVPPRRAWWWVGVAAAAALVVAVLRSSWRHPGASVATGWWVKP